MFPMDPWSGFSTDEKLDALARTVFGSHPGDMGAGGFTCMGCHQRLAASLQAVPLLPATCLSCRAKVDP
jgi:hypothetical protein